MICELERIRKESAVAYFKVLSYHLFEGTEEIHLIPELGQPVSGPISNQGPPEYEGGVLTTPPRRLVTI
jgi:hypothetical protein